MEYRNEWKFLLDAAQAARVRFLMERMLTPDPHAKDGGYRVESLYFDDLYSTALSENLGGVDDRQKFRVRSYGSGGLLRLEDKQKSHGFTRKQSCALSQEELWALCRGKPPAIDPARPVLNRMGVALRTRRLRPAVTVLYDRAAYVGRAGNVRVTLDSGIRALPPEGFLALGGPSRLLLGPGEQILEVKFDELLPQALAQTLELGQMHQIAFSKYTLCRQAMPLSWSHQARQYRGTKGAFV